jgi:hypothetical protein
VKGATPLGDIALTLISVDELLRDLATIAAYPSSAEFRNIEVVAIETRSPLKIKLSLFAIPAEAVKAFQEICRDIVFHREREGRPALTASEWEDVNAKRLANIKTALDIGSSSGDGDEPRITDQEAQRLNRHMMTLQHAEVPLKRVDVKDE